MGSGGGFLNLKNKVLYVVHACLVANSNTNFLSNAAKILSSSKLPKGKIWYED